MSKEKELLIKVAAALEKLYCYARDIGTSPIIPKEAMAAKIVLLELVEHFGLKEGDILQDLLHEAKECLREREKGPLCVIDCGEHGYFKIWGNWPSYDPPTFTPNLEEAFVYDENPSMMMNTLQDIRDTLERYGYEAVIIEKEDCKE